MPKRVAEGIVTSAKMAKTRIVEIPRIVKHSKYGKYLRQRTICYVHDEHEQASQGDTVEIIESRPRSLKKRWELVRVIQHSRVAERSDVAGEAAQAAALVSGVPVRVQWFKGDHDIHAQHPAELTEAILAAERDGFFLGAADVAAATDVAPAAEQATT